MRPIFVVQVRAEFGVDATRALRGWLKIGLRDFRDCVAWKCVKNHKPGRLKCLSI
jgi:hypothetical protein